MHLIVGRVVRPHGIRGEVVVDVRTDEPQARFRVGTALLTGTAAGPGGAGGGGRRRDDVPDDVVAGGTSAPAVRWTVPDELILEQVREHQGRLLVTFAGVGDRNLAEELRGVLLWADVAGVPAPSDPDEFHDHQLVGLRAVSPGGEVLGEVARVDHAPASDLLVLRRPAGGQSLVPFVKAIVPEVDLAGGRVVVDAPEGLFDL